MKAYLVLTRLIALAVVLQAAFIALGTFSILSDADDGKTLTDSSDYNAGQAAHSVGAMVLSLLVIIALIVALVSKFRGGAKHAGLLFLAVVLQWAFAIFAFEAPIVGLLHGANAIVILVLAIRGEAVVKAARAPEPVAV